MWVCPLPPLAPGMAESMALRGGGYSMAPCPRVQDETMANMSSRTKSAMAALMMARRVRMAGVWGRCAAGWTPETAAAVDAELPRWSPAGTGGYPEGWQQEEGVRARAADELRAGAVGVKMGMTHTYSVWGERIPLTAIQVRATPPSPPSPLSTFLTSPALSSRTTR